MTHRFRIVLSLLLLSHVVALSFGLSLILPLPFALATALLATAILSWPLSRLLRARMQATPASAPHPQLAGLHRLPPAVYEDLIANVFRSLGFTVDEMDYRGNTYLADFILQHERRGEIVVAIARQQPPDEALEKTPLQQLLKAVERFHASRGILVTTGQIPQEVKKTAQASDASIELIDGHLLRKMAYNVQIPPA